MKGKFIVVEGIDGAGKSTVCGHILGVLAKAGIPVISTNEPGGTQLGMELKTILGSDTPIEPEAELLMIQAARAQHIKTVLIPALEAGKWVVCDRYILSTMAYQGIGRGLGTHKCAISRFLVPGLIPDLTLILDIPVDVAMSRMLKRGGSLDRFEKLGEDFFNEARKFYRNHALAPQMSDSPRILIDANSTPDNVNQGAMGIIIKHFNLTNEGD